MKSRMDIKFEIKPEFKHCMNSHNICNIIRINKEEYYAVTTEELIKFDKNQIKATFNYKLIAAVLAEYDLLLGVSYIGGELVVIDTKNMQIPLIKNFKLGMNSTFHMIYSKASHSIIIFGSSIKVFSLIVKNFSWKISAKASDFDIIQRASFADGYSNPILNEPTFDYERELIFLPTNNGLAAYNLDGKQVSLVTKLPLSSNSVFSFQPESRKIFTSDSTNGGILWDKYGNLVSRFNINNVVLSLHFINKEHAFFMNPKGYMFILNVKTQRSFVCYTLDQIPNRIFVFLEDGIRIVTCNGQFVSFYKATIPWKVWAKNIFHTVSIERIPSLNQPARICILTQNSFAKIFSPKTARLLTSATPYQSFPQKSAIYDRGLVVYYQENKRVIEKTLQPDDSRDQIFMLLSNGVLTSFSTGSSPCDQIKTTQMKFDIMIRAKYQGQWAYCFASKKGDINFADYNSLRLIRRFVFGSSRVLKNMLYLPQSEQILMIFQDSIALVETNRGKIVSEIDMNCPSVAGTFRDLIFLGYKTGSILCVSYSDNKLVLLNEDQNTRYHSDAVTGFSFSEKCWVSSSLDQTIILWDYEFSTIGMVHLPLPILTCEILNAKHDVLVATDTEIMIVPGYMFHIENEEEVREIDNYDRLVDALNEFCFLPGDFEDDEDNKPGFFDNIPKDEKPANVPEEDKKYSWDNFDTNLLKAKVFSFKIKRNGGDAGNDKKGESDGDEKNKKGGKGGTDDLDDEEKAAILREMSGMSDGIDDRNSKKKKDKDDKKDEKNGEEEGGDGYSDYDDGDGNGRGGGSGKGDKGGQGKRGKNGENGESFKGPKEDNGANGSSNKTARRRRNNGEGGEHGETGGNGNNGSNGKTDISDKKNSLKSKVPGNNNNSSDAGKGKTGKGDSLATNKSNITSNKDTLINKGTSSSEENGTSTISELLKRNKTGSLFNSTLNDKTVKFTVDDGKSPKEPKEKKSGEKKARKGKKGKNARNSDPSQDEGKNTLDKKTKEADEGPPPPDELKFRFRPLTPPPIKNVEIRMKNPKRPATPPLRVKVRPFETPSCALALDAEKVIQEFASGRHEFVSFIKDLARDITSKDSEERDFFSQTVSQIPSPRLSSSTQSSRGQKRTRKESKPASKTESLDNQSTSSKINHSSDDAQSSVSTTKTCHSEQHSSSKQDESKQSMQKVLSDADFERLNVRRKSHDDDTYECERKMRIETIYKGERYPLSLVTVLKTPDFGKKERKILYDTSLLEQQNTEQISEEQAEQMLKLMQVIKESKQKTTISARVMVKKPSDEGLRVNYSGEDSLQLAVCQKVPEAYPLPLNDIHQTIQPDGVPKSPRYKYPRPCKTAVLPKRKNIQLLDLNEIMTSKFEITENTVAASPRMISKASPRIKVPTVRLHTAPPL